jgi:hypothetical protein
VLIALWKLFCEKLMEMMTNGELSNAKKVFNHISPFMITKTMHYFIKNDLIIRKTLDNICESIDLLKFGIKPS